MFPHPDELLPVYSVRNVMTQREAPPILIDGKMATDNCNSVNTETDMELLSDEEIERCEQ